MKFFKNCSVYFEYIYYQIVLLYLSNGLRRNLVRWDEILFSLDLLMQKFSKVNKLNSGFLKRGIGRSFFKKNFFFNGFRLPYYRAFLKKLFKRNSLFTNSRIYKIASFENLVRRLLFFIRKKNKSSLKLKGFSFFCNRFKNFSFYKKYFSSREKFVFVDFLEFFLLKSFFVKKIGKLKEH